jgi:hypothetical protein
MIWLFPRIEYIKINKSINAHNLPFYPIVLFFWKKFVLKLQSKVIFVDSQGRTEDGASRAAA